MTAIMTDTLVVGSGAGGLAAAVTARLGGLDVIVVEKEPLFGGASARSGGWLWIPCNPHAREAGIADSPAEARRYLQHEAANHFDGERVDAFLANGPEMVSFFETNTAVKFVLGPAFPTTIPTHPARNPAVAPSSPSPSTAASSAPRSSACARRSPRSPSSA